MLRERCLAKELHDARSYHANVLYDKVLRYFRHLSLFLHHLLLYATEVSRPRVERASRFVLLVYKEMYYKSYRARRDYTAPNLFLFNFHTPGSDSEECTFSPMKIRCMGDVSFISS